MKLTDLLLLIGLAAVWGGSFLIMRIAAPIFGPVPLVLVRLTLASFFLMPVAAARKEFPGLSRPWKAMFVAGFLNCAFPFCLLAFAALKISAGLASVLNSTTPVIAGFIGAVFLHQKLRFSQWFGFALCICGVVLLSRDRLKIGGLSEAPAIAACLLAAFCYAVGAHYSKSRLALLSPMTTTVGTLTAAALLTIPIGVAQWPHGGASTAAWIGGTVLGILCTGIAYLIYYKLLGSIGATRTSSVTIIVPVFAVIWGYLFLGEKLTLPAIIGMGIALVGSVCALGLIPQKKGGAE